ncbi:hypothetical protein Tco_1371440 [Tanacetum coccineum]
MVQPILNRFEGKLFVAVDDEHRLELNNIVELLVRAVDDTEENCIEFEEWYRKTVCYKNRVNQSLNHAYSLLA